MSTVRLTVLSMLVAAGVGFGALVLARTLGLLP